MHQSIIILDFGSQVTQLIARRVRELNIYCEIHPWNKMPTLHESVCGVILSGSPYSVHQEGAPMPDLSGILGKWPVLGICYGAQLLAKLNGGEVVRSTHREYGRAHLFSQRSDSALMKHIPADSQVWMSHGDTILSAGPDTHTICSTADVAVAGYERTDIQAYGVQFHPEVYHSLDGTQLLRNFVVDICGCKQDWTPLSFVDETVAELKARIGSDVVIMGLSGGVDSTVAAVLIQRAIGNNLHCIFVDNGLLRKNEFHDVLESYKVLGLNVTGVDAS
ncbi:MAG: glutamine-hydrolyzing GMP synthase, partial [Flavobacteriales bacterium]